MPSSDFCRAISEKKIPPIELSFIMSLNDGVIGGKHTFYVHARRPLYIVDKEGQLIWPYTLRGLLIKILVLLFVITSTVFNFAYQMRHHLKALTFLHSTIAKKLHNIVWLWYNTLSCPKHVWLLFDQSINFGSIN